MTARVKLARSAITCQPSRLAWRLCILMLSKMPRDCMQAQITPLVSAATRRFDL
jgi:hypothetical protein